MYHDVFVIIEKCSNDAQNWLRLRPLRGFVPWRVACPGTTSDVALQFQSKSPIAASAALNPIPISSFHPARQMTSPIFEALNRLKGSFGKGPGSRRSSSVFQLGAANSAHEMAEWHAAHDAACGELPSLSSTRKPLPNGNKSVRVHMMTQAPRRTGKPLLSPCNAPWPTAWVLATAIRKSVPSRRAARLGSSSTTLKSQIEPAFCKEPYK